ncbi:MAG TPA: hypothetical protein VGB14_14295 [Acidimicrobiales bacterium]
MPDRPYVDHLEADLADLGRALDVPPPPATLAADVRARLEREAGASPPVRAAAWGRRSVRGPFPSARTTWLAAAAVVLVVALGAGVALRGGDAGVDVRVGATSPTTEPPAAPVGVAAGLGTPASLADAAALLGDDLLLPDHPDLGPPDEVLVRRTTSPPVVFFLWRPAAGLPEVGDSGIGLLVTEVEGRTGCTYKTMKEEAGSATETFADGWRALWVEGRHVLRYCTVKQVLREQPARLDANALIWSEGSFTYRIEAGVARAEAEAIAATMD